MHLNYGISLNFRGPNTMICGIFRNYGELGSLGKVSSGPLHVTLEASTLNPYMGVSENRGP